MHRTSWTRAWPHQMCMLSRQQLEQEAAREDIRPASRPSQNPSNIAHQHTHVMRLPLFALHLPAPHNLLLPGWMAHAVPRAAGLPSVHLQSAQLFHSRMQSTSSMTSAHCSSALTSPPAAPVLTRASCLSRPFLQCCVLHPVSGDSVLRRFPPAAGSTISTWLEQTASAKGVLLQPINL